MKKSNEKKVVVGVGLGLAAAAAAGAGYFFFGAQSAAKNRKAAKKWAHDMKAEVIKKAKLAKKLDEKAVKTIVTEAAKAYEKIQSVDKNDLRDLAAELKGNWTEVKKEVERTTSKSVVAAKKVAKKAVKEVAKKVAKSPAKKVAKKKS